ncbi:adenylate/guanylate cyclase domain-containing protein [Ferrovibrio terrae]|uniref:adenylate/guanylate cyclase domain-containing protein n=1 Tax=Ferrovibrio terrae TaxID=2594003 RepID=UPI0031383B94
MTFFSAIASLPFKVSILRSVGAKIFAIAASLLAIMVLVAVVASQMARIVSDELTLIEQHYVPAYSALARAHIRSVEEDLAVRRLIVHVRSGDMTTNEHNEAYRADIFKAIEGVRSELGVTRQHLAALLAWDSYFHNDQAIARVDAQLEMMLEIFSKEERVLTPVLDGLAAEDWQKVYGALDAIEDRTTEINERLERYRTEMRSILQTAASNARSFQENLMLANMIVTILACALGLVAAGFITRSLVRPVKALLLGAQRIESGSLDVDLPVSSRDEIGQLTASFNVMVEELRKKERIRDTFGRYMDPRIVEGLLERPDLAHSEGERRVMTVLFCDMQGFTALSERLSPAALLAVVNRYLTLMSEPVRQHNGVIDKYIGDAIMAYWGPPFVASDRQAMLACEAALDMMKQLDRFNAELPDLIGMRGNLPKINIRIGIATGEMLVGSIGSEFSQSYSVLGDSVNLASRLEAANKSYGTRIMINTQTRNMVGDQFALREIDMMRVVGKTEPERVYELYGPAGAVQHERDTAFAEALAAYRQGNWAAARRYLEQKAGEDPLAEAFLTRIAILEKDTPEAWDGIWTMTQK